MLCLLQAGELTAVSLGGQSHSLPLLTAFTRLWPLPQGVLLTVSIQPSLGVTGECSYRLK